MCGIVVVIVNLKKIRIDKAYCFVVKCLAAEQRLLSESLKSPLAGLKQGGSVCGAASRPWPPLCSTAKVWSSSRDDSEVNNVTADTLNGILSLFRNTRTRHVSTERK